MSDTPETDAARLCGYGYFSGALVPVERKCYEKDPDGDVVFYEVAEKLERERDEARRECNEAQDGWSKALDERDEARRELAETISCIEQAIDFHQVHHQFNSAAAIKNLLENINQRRKHDAR